MESVTDSEMRSNSDELLRRAAAGEAFVVTSDGAPVAMLVPAVPDGRTRLTAAGRLRVGTGLDLAQLPQPVRSQDRTADLLEEDRRG